MTTIDVASAGDLPDILAINRESTSVHDAARIDYLADAAGRGACLLAREDGAAAAFAVWDASFYGFPFVWLLAVRPASRRRGIASALMRRVEAASGRDRVFTSTNESNTAMRALCTALGYAPSGRIDNLDEGDPELVFCRRLPGSG